MTTPQLRPDDTASRLDWLAETLAENKAFEAAQRIAPHLGAQPRKDGAVEVGFWTPAIVEAGIPESDVYLELFTPTEGRSTLRPPSRPPRSTATGFP